MVLAGVLTGALIYMLGFEDVEDSVERERHHHAVALTTASSIFSASVEAARTPLEVVDLSQRQTLEAMREGARPPNASDAPVIEQWQEGKPSDFKGIIARNESVSLALQKRGLSNQAIHAAISSVGQLYDFRHSRPGDEWLANVNAEGQITRFRYKTSPEDIWEAQRKGDGSYQSEKVEVPLEVRSEAIGGKVTTSLWQSMEQAGLSAPIVGKFIDIFSHEIDFGAQTQPGDHFSVIFENVYLDGQFLRTGRVLAARYVTPAKSYAAYFYETSDEDEQGYYDASGKSLQRQFLKSPLTSVRITSLYGRRFHPVLKRWKLHAGIDYGAPTGTPVMSVADGTVTFAGWKGANGKLVTVKHKNGYTTHYAHLSYIPSTIKPGLKVTKKTLIGKVGSTGRSTGPHLHFGMSKNGNFVDPLKVDMMRAPSLAGKELQRYQESILQPMNVRLEDATSKNTATVNVVSGLDSPGGAQVYEDNGEELY